MMSPPGWPPPSGHAPSTGTRRAPVLFSQFLRNVVWHYKELESRATEEPVKDIPVKQEDRGVTYKPLLEAFQSVRSVRYDLTSFRNTSLFRTSIRVTCNTIFPIITKLFSPHRRQRIALFQCHLAEKDTSSRIQRACSSVTISVSGKALCLCGPATVCSCSLTSSHLMALSTKRSIPTPPTLFRHYRHHCPQNGWQLLEIPGCVTTLRCTCCAIYAPPVLMPQQPERQRRITPAMAQVVS